LYDSENIYNVEKRREEKTTIEVAVYWALPVLLLSGCTYSPISLCVLLHGE